MSERDRKGQGSSSHDRDGGESESSGHQGPLQFLVERFGEAGANAIYKRTIQRRRAARLAAESAADVHAAAEKGISGVSGPLPHLDAIQKSFGHHDVSHVKAHTDGAAANNAAAMGAEAFATGDHVAFAGSPSLHTAAHEAAHVVQQRGGVQLKGGVGQIGDRYEQHADAVADRVVAGQSAVDLLDIAGPASSAGVGMIQKQETHKDGQGSPQDVAKLPKAQKLGAAIKRSGHFLGPEAAAKIEALVQPEALATLAGVLVGGAIVQAIPVVGEVADVALVAWGVYSLGMEAIHVLKEFIAFVKGALSANSEAELDTAGHHFANFVTTVGIDAAVALLLHKAAKDVSKAVNESLPPPGVGGGRAMATAGGPSVRAAAVPKYRVLTDGTIIELTGAAVGTAVHMSSSESGGGGGGPVGDSGHAGGTTPKGGGTAEPKRGTYVVEDGASPSPGERAAAQYWLDQGKKVTAKRPVSETGVEGVRTADMEVEGVGKVDVVEPAPSTSSNNVVRRILQKSDQASTIQVELADGSAVTPAEAARLPNRVFGHPKAGKAINRIVVRQNGSVILDATRK
jgi:hypothetical protein